MNEATDIPPGVDTGRPTPARIYDYMLQGSNYFQADRMAAIHRGFTTRDRNTRRVSSASVRVLGASGTAESPM